MRGSTSTCGSRGVIRWCSAITWRSSPSPASRIRSTRARRSCRLGRRFGQPSTRDLPALGICLGAQLLAQAGGAATGRCESEYGYGPVQLAASAQSDRLLWGLPAEIEVFHAHDFAVSLPPGGMPLGTNRERAPGVSSRARRLGLPVPSRAERGDRRRLGREPPGLPPQSRCEPRGCRRGCAAARSGR